MTNIDFINFTINHPDLTSPVKEEKESQEDLKKKFLQQNQQIQKSNNIPH